MHLNALIREVDIRATSSGVAEATRAADNLGRAVDGAAASSDRMTRSQISAERALERVRRQYDQYYRVAQGFAQAEAALERARQQGLIGLDEQARLLSLAQQRLESGARASNVAAAANDNLGRSTEVARRHLVNLGYQLNDVVTMLASGSSPMQVLATQGGQVVQILGETGVRGALGAILGLIGPLTIGVAGFAAAGLLLGLAFYRATADAELLKQSLKGVGAGSGETVNSLNELALRAAEVTKISTASARAAAAEYASTGEIEGRVIAGLIEITQRYAKTTAQTMADAGKDLSKAFSDPVKGADALNAKLGFLDDRTREYIRQLVDQNDKTAAQEVLLRAMTPTLDRVTERTTALGQAWDFVARNADAAWEAMKRSADRAMNGPPATAESVRELTQKRDAAQKAADGGFWSDPLGTAARSAGELNKQVSDLTQKMKDDAFKAAFAKQSQDAAKTALEVGEISRGLDPVQRKFNELGKKRDTIAEAMKNYMVQGKLADDLPTQKLSQQFDALTDARLSLLDANGKLISQQDVLRQKEQLQLDQLRDVGPAEKERIARQLKLLDTMGEVITKQDRERQVTHAGTVARIEAEKSVRDQVDAYDSAMQRSRDMVVELEQQAAQAGRTSAETYRLAEQHRLLRAAMQAGRADDAGVVTAIKQQADAYAQQRVATEQAIETNRRMRDSQREMAQQFTSFANDILTGTDGINGAFKNLGRTFTSHGLNAILTGTGPFAGALGTASNDNRQTGGLLGGVTPGQFRNLVADGTAAGTEKGVVGLYDYLGPSAATSGGAGSGLGGLGLGNIAAPVGGIMALAGAYGAGQQAQSPMMAGIGGALSGAMGGAMLGAQLGTGLGPLGAVAGGVLGLGLGIFGQQQAKKQQRQQQMQAAMTAYQEASPQIAQTRAALNTGSDRPGALRGNIDQMQSQVAELQQVMQQAWRFDEATQLGRDLDVWKAKLAEDFRGAFPDMLAALQSGLGTNGPFAAAKAEIAALGAELTSFIDDARIAGADVEGARQASVAMSLAQLRGVDALSTVQSELQRIDGVAAGLTRVLADLGVSADAAAAAIDDATAVALDRLTTTFTDELQRQINDASGKGYLNEVDELLAKVDRARADAASLGVSQQLVDQYYVASAQKIVDGAELTGAAFDALLQQFPQLTGAVHAFAAAADDAAIKARALGYDDRLFAAGNATDTLGGQLAAYDRQAQRERADEIKAGGEAIAQLEAAQMAERLNIVKEFAAKERQALREAQTFLEGVTRQIRQYVDGLQAGSNSPLSPADRLSAAQAQYTSQLALAQGGSRDAIQGLTGYADALLDAAKAQYASGAGYQAVVDQLLAQLGALPDQVSAEQYIVNAIDENTGELTTAIEANGPGQISTSLLPHFALLDTSINGLLDYGEFAQGLGPLATKSEQQAAYAVFQAIDANGDGAISAIELMSASLLGAVQANSPSLVAAALSGSFAQLDTTMDGRLTAAELLAGLGPLATKAEQEAAKTIFASIDANGDGLISAIEAMSTTLLSAVQANSPTALAGALAPHFTALDTTMDGRLTADELIAGLGPLATKSEQASARSLLASIDADGDGMITAIELMRTSVSTAVASNSPGAIATALSTHFGTLDTSVNGLLDRTELATALGPLATAAGQDAAAIALGKIDGSTASQITKTDLLRTTLTSAVQANSPTALAAALAPNFTTLNTTMDGRLTSAQLLSGLGPLATKSEQAAALAVFNRIDADGDGIITKLELTRTTLNAAIAANSPSLVATALSGSFATLDTSVNGLLDRTELATALGPLATKSEQAAALAVFSRIDANGDDLLSAIELMSASLLGAVQANSPELLSAALESHFAALDSTVDGLLTSAELVAGLGPLATKAEQTAAKTLLAAIDANGDGFVSAIELMNTNLGTAITSNSPAKIATALSTYFNKIDTSVNGTLDYAELMAGFGNANIANNAQLGLIKGALDLIDINGDGQIDKLELVRAQAAATNTNTSNIHTNTAYIQGNTSSTAYQTQTTADQIGNGLRPETRAGNDVLSAIQGLNTTQVATLTALNNQFSLNSSINIGGQTLSSNMVTALNKIVYNTAGTWSAVAKTSVPAAYAGGGWISGPGTGTSDSIMAAVSNGEFVVNAQSAARNAGLLEAINGGRDLMSTVFASRPVSDISVPALPPSITVRAAGNDNSAAREVRALREEVRGLRAELAQLTAATVNAGARVAGRVDAVRDQTEGLREDRRRSAKRGMAVAGR